MNPINNTNLNDALLYICLTSITNLTNQKYPNALLTAFLKKTSKSETDRNVICSQKCRLTNEKWTIDQEGLTLCNRNDCLELELSQEEKIIAYIRFPLEQLLDMPRVTHQIQCLLLKYQKWDSIDRSPLKNIAQVDFSLIAFNKILGKFVISSVQVELTRNTELIGKMDPYVEFKLHDQVKKTDVREDEGMHCIWNQRIQFQLNDINRNFLLSVDVLDKDNISSDLVGSIKIDLITQRMLLPEQDVRQRGFTLIFNEESAGRIKIEFQFIPTPYNF